MKPRLKKEAANDRARVRPLHFLLRALDTEMKPDLVIGLGNPLMGMTGPAPPPAEFSPTTADWRAAST